MSAEIGSAGAAGAAGAGAAAGAASLALGASAFFLVVGISLKSSTAALLITTLSRSLTLVRKTIFVSPSFHISVTSVSPGKTLSAKRTRMLLKKRGSFPEKALITAWAA